MREQITFVLNGTIEIVRDVAPTTTLLTYLRRTRRLTGTKEGCAEGDCGACTVVIVDRDAETGACTPRAVNACILLLPMVEGRAVRTVEALAGPDGRLHPCQQAMVDCHGSQCGFCTPGFVMSLAVAYETEPAPSRKRIDDLLAGNLCRCTGYGPIARAAATMQALPAPPWMAELADREAVALARIAHADTMHLAHDGRQAFAPATLPALLALAEANPEATLVAGATDVGLWVTKQHRPLPTTIHIGRVAELQAVTGDAHHLRIGAGVTYTRAFEALATLADDLGELVRRIGGMQVRNSGTVGGNIANGSPIGDMAPALIALDATLILRKGGQERQLPVEDFFIAYGRQDRAPGEILTAIEIPRPTDRTRLKVFKISKRFDQDISAVCGAFDVRVGEGYVTAARIAFGGMAATPRRAIAVEGALLGARWTREGIAPALAAFAQDFTPISDMRASADYRLAVARNLLVRTLIETTQPAVATRLAGSTGADHARG